MGRNCRGWCVTYDVESRTSNGTGGKETRKSYREGYKRCTTCSYTIKTDIIRCKCCGNVYRITARTYKSRDAQRRAKVVQ